MKLTDEKSKNTVAYITGGIEYVIRTFDKRPPGSKGERDTQNYFSSELGRYMDKVKTEDFKINPKSFMGWINITATCLVLAQLSYFFAPAISVVLVVAGAFCMLSQLVLYKQWLDPLFKEETSVNVYAAKAPQGQIKKRVILCGHTDAAYEWHWHYKFGFAGFVAILCGTVFGSLFLLAVSIAKLAIGSNAGMPELDIWFWLGAASLPFLVFYLACYKFTDFSVVVDGANDNLTACYMSMAVAKLLDEGSFELKNTELGVLLTGSEEAGLRGSRAFCKAHKDDFNDAETIVICFETLRDEQHLSVYTKEINGFYKTDEQVAKLINRAGKELGIDVPLRSSEFAGTDSAAFGEYGLKSTCIAALNHNLQRYYHTRLDSFNNLNPELLGKVLDVTLTAIGNFDKDGLKE